MKHVFNEVTISILLVILLLFFLDPLMLLMPSHASYALMAGLVVVFVIFAGLMWREKPLDERDEMHRMHAGRIGYLLGTITLLGGVIAQSLSGHVDPWLVLALGGMVLGKLLGLYVSRMRH